MAVFLNVISMGAARTAVVLVGLVLTATAAAPSPVLTSNGPHPGQVEQREVLLNGLPVVSRTIASDRVAVVCIVRAGAMFDPSGKSGLAALTASMLRRGAGSYTAERIDAELKDAGATLEVEPRWDGVWIKAAAPAAELSTLLDVVSLIVTAPRLDATAFEAAKKEAIEAAMQRESTPEGVAEIAFARALYGGHTYARTVHGTASSLATLTRGDVQYFFDRFYGAASSVLAVSGPRSLDELIRLAKPRFGRWLKGRAVPATFLPPAAAAATRIVVVDWPSAGTATVRAGFLAPGRKTPQDADEYQLPSILEKRFRARTSGVSDVSASWTLRALDSPFVVSFRVDAGQVAPSLQALSEAMRTLSDGPVASEEILSGSADARGSLLDETTSLAARNYYEAQKLSPGGEWGTSKGAAAVTAAARTILKPDALTVTIVGRAAEVVEPLKAKGYAVEVVPKP